MIKVRFFSILLFFVFLASWTGEQATVGLSEGKEPILLTISEAAELQEGEGLLESISGSVRSSVFPRHLSKFKKDPFGGSYFISILAGSFSFCASSRSHFPESSGVPLFLINRSILI